MTEKESAKRSNLLKFEATMLFTQIKNQLDSSRWFFFGEARRQAFSLQISQSISPYRASLHFRYALDDYLYDAYLEREAHVGHIGEDLWTLSFPGIEGKTAASLLRNRLAPLRLEGFDIPNGEEYLDRQMNFSLGLYAACLMRVDVRFPISAQPFPSFCRIFDHLDSCQPARIDLKEIENRNTSTSDSENEDDEIMYGDWQTWK